MNDKVPTTPPLQETERDRWNYDVGFEDGATARGTQNVRTPAEQHEELARILGVVDQIAATLRDMIEKAAEQ